MPDSNDSDVIPFELLATNQEIQRVDQLLAAAMPELGTRSQIKQRLRKLMVNGKPSKLSAGVICGDQVLGELSAPETMDIQPEHLAAEIIYEDENVLLVNKPYGMVVHPACGNWTGTLLHGVLGHVNDLAENFAESDNLRPGIVHRLDKDTSGILIVAKNPKAHAFLADQFAQRLVGKMYLAVSMGVPESLNGRIEARIARDPSNRKRYAVTKSASAGKEAATRFGLLGAGGKYAFLALYPETGRTHQLRVHLKHIGCPILGDPVYARKRSSREGDLADSRLMLHAAALRILIPGKSKPDFFCAPPDDSWIECFQKAQIIGLAGRDHVLPADTGWYEAQLQSLMADR